METAWATVQTFICRYAELIRFHFRCGRVLFVGQQTMLTGLSPCISVFKIELRVLMVRPTPSLFCDAYSKMAGKSEKRNSLHALWNRLWLTDTHEHCAEYAFCFNLWRLWKLFLCEQWVELWILIKLESGFVSNFLRVWPAWFLFYRGWWVVGWARLGWMF